MDNFLQHAIKRLKEYRDLGEKAMQQLSDDQLNMELSPGANSIAVIVKHMHGNMLSRWTGFLTEDGEKPWRRRDEEFEETRTGKEEIFNLWNEGWALVLDTLGQLKDDDLQKTITIRSQPLQVLDAILRQLAHYSYHVGQIVYLAKHFKKDEWQSLSIPRGASREYNSRIAGNANG